MRWPKSSDSPRPEQPLGRGSALSRLGAELELRTLATEPGELPVEMLRSEPENSENENLLRNVRIAATS